MVVADEHVEGAFRRLRKQIRDLKLERRLRPLGQQAHVNTSVHEGSCQARALIAKTSEGIQGCMEQDSHSKGPYGPARGKTRGLDIAQR
jgi:hypothetical protein